MTTSTVVPQPTAAYQIDETVAVAEWVQVAQVAPESRITQMDTASIRIQSLDPVNRKIELPKKVLRRLRGFLIEAGGEEAKVAFVEEGNTFEYYLPAHFLEKAGIRAENQPFQMDEVEIKTESGILIGYEFRALAKPSDAFRDSFELDAEHERKRDLIFRTFRNAEA